MASMASSRFGERLRRARQAAGLTQAELAERAGLSVRGVNDLERGARQSPRKDTVALLAEALGMADEERAAFEAAARRATRRAASETNTAGPPSAVQRESTAPALPSGTVTLLFSGLEDSTILLQRFGAQRYEVARAEHLRLLRAACAEHGGIELDTQGDAFFVAFPTVPGALAAAAQSQQALAAQFWLDGTPVHVRMGLHTGTPLVESGGGGYMGWTWCASPASPRLGMAGRCWSRRRPAAWPSKTCRKARACATWESIV
jgi:transcriptional regulator with XRE-family HTH domain